MRRQKSLPPFFQVERLTEFLFSGRPKQDFLDPNSILGDDTTRRASSTSSGKRKISIDHLFANLGLAPGNHYATETPNIIKDLLT
jgi:hypothetical protein